MADWNKKGVIFNRRNQEGGFTWNSDYYIELKDIYESVKISESLSNVLAIYVLSEKVKATDKIASSVLFDKFEEDFFVYDNQANVSILFETVDSFGMRDELSDFVVQAFLDEKFDLLEDLKTFASILTSDFISVKEIVNLQTFLQTLDKFGFYDLVSELKSFFNVHDEFGMTDHERHAVSDFLIGVEGTLDRSVDWLLPFELQIDWRNTVTPNMPPASLTEVEIPYLDGTIIENTTYGNRLFSIVGYSVDALTKAEKDDLCSRICDILDTTKNKSRTITVQARDVMFDCKYAGEADIKQGPSFVYAKIPLQVGPYGKSLFPAEFSGDGLLDNTHGDAPLKPKITIDGPIENPSFNIGGHIYSWIGLVPERMYLVLDFEKMTCYLEDNAGNRTNALAKLKGDFISIPAKKSAVLSADENTKSHINTEYQNPILW